MNFGYSLRYFQNNPDITPGLNLPTKRYQTFFANGYKLGMKYLGSKNLLTYKLNILCRSKITEKVPEMITTDDENPRKPLKKPFYNEQSSNRSEYESSNDEFQGNMKSFRINSKKNLQGKTSGFSSRENLKNCSENAYFPSKYFTQIKEMEGTLTDIKQMREFYEREKRLLEEQQMKKMDLVNNGMNFYGNNVHSPHESKGTWMNNYMNPMNLMNNPMNLMNNPMNLMTSPMNLMNNPMNLMNNNNNNHFFDNNGQFNGNNEQFNNHNQKFEQMNTKQQELEDKLLKMKLENDEIIKDRETKQNELSQLKKMIEEINFTRKINEEKNKKFENSNKNSENSNKNLVNSNKSSQNKERTSLRINENISPCSSSKNIEEVQQSPEISNKYNGKFSPGKYANKEERNFKLSLSNLKSEEKNNEEFMGILKEKKDVNTPKEVKFKKVETFSKIASKTNIQPENINKIEITNKSNSKESADFGAIMKKNEKNEKNIKNLTNKITSEQSIPANKALLHRKSDRSSKNTRISSIDFLSDTTNPGILLKNLLPNFPRSFPVKKQLVFNEMLFTIECRIIDEKELAYFLLQGKNESEEIVLNEEKLPIQLFSKILQIVDVRDVMPYEVPIKTMEGYEDFMRYCVMPFLGVCYL